MPGTALQIDGLSKSYGGQRSLDGVSLTVAAGESLGVVGPNGAGKTTLIRCVLGLAKPDAGSVRIFGAPAGEPAALSRVGFCPERPYLYAYLTGEELLALLGRLSGLAGRHLKARTDAVLSLVGLADARKKPLRTYSKGMQQRLLLAQALLHDPEIVILDEPLSGLDPAGRELVTETLDRLRQAGKTLLFTSHVLSDVQKVCDRVALIAHGRLVASETIANVLAHPRAQVGAAAFRYHLLANTPGDEAAILGALQTAGAEARHTGTTLQVATRNDRAAAAVTTLVREGRVTLVSLAPLQGDLDAWMRGHLEAAQSEARP
jgi:ABC-2 type transport system ATP-binding protein